MEMAIALPGLPPPRRQTATRLPPSTMSCARSCAATAASLLEAAPPTFPRRGACRTSHGRHVHMPAAPARRRPRRGAGQEEVRRRRRRRRRPRRRLRDARQWRRGAARRAARGRPPGAPAGTRQSSHSKPGRAVSENPQIKTRRSTTGAPAGARKSSEVTQNPEIKTRRSTAPEAQGRQPQDNQRGSSRSRL